MTAAARDRAAVRERVRTAFARCRGTRARRARAAVRRNRFDLAFVPGDNRYAWLARALVRAGSSPSPATAPRAKNWPVDELRPYPDRPAGVGRHGRDARRRPAAGAVRTDATGPRLPPPPSRCRADPTPCCTSARVRRSSWAAGPLGGARAHRSPHGASRRSGRPAAARRRSSRDCDPDWRASRRSPERSTSRRCGTCLPGARCSSRPTPASRIWDASSARRRSRCSDPAPRRSAGAGDFLARCALSRSDHRPVPVPRPAHAVQARDPGCAAARARSRECPHRAACRRSRSTPCSPRSTSFAHLPAERSPRAPRSSRSTCRRRWAARKSTRRS